MYPVPRGFDPNREIYMERFHKQMKCKESTGFLKKLIPIQRCPPLPEIPPYYKI